MGLASPVEMSDEVIDKWIKQLEHYKLSQPLEQLTLVKLNKKNLQKEIKKLSTIEGTYGAFKDFAKRYEMYIHDKFGDSITYTFQSNDDDILSMSADIDEDTEYDDIIEIKLSFENKNYNKISRRFIYTFLVFIICGFKLDDLL